MLSAAKNLLLPLLLPLCHSFHECEGAPSFVRSLHKGWE
jgi:hypothetical protein